MVGAYGALLSFAVGTAQSSQTQTRAKSSMASQIIFVIEVLSAAFVAWLGLYVITRDLPFRRIGPRSAISVSGCWRATP